MKLEFDPVWPWSEVGKFLASTDPPVQAGIWLTALAALLLPALFLRLPSTRLRRQFLTGGAVWLALVAYWILRYGTPGNSASFGERLGNCGLAMLLILPLGVVGWMVRVYLQAPGVTGRRLAWVLGLRLLAVLLALVAVTRPILGFPDVRRGSSVVRILVDSSESMTIQDESGQSRWDYLLRTLRDCQPIFERVRSERGIEVEFYHFAREPARWQLDDPGKPAGKRTDIGWALRWLHDQRDTRPIKALFLLSDGRNNGDRRINKNPVTPLSEAKHWRKVGKEGCPIHTVLLGNPTTANNQRDIAITRVTPTAGLIQVKSDLAVQVRIDAPGFESDRPRYKVRVFLDDKEVQPESVETLQRTILPPDDGSPAETRLEYKKWDKGIVPLKESRNNEVLVKLCAPDDPGEYKLTVKVEDPHRPGQPLSGELNATNNSGSTLIDVTRGGISILVIDRPRAFEPKFIYEVLRSDNRLHEGLRMVWLGGQKPLDPRTSDLFQFARKKYDVIILGDVTAQQIRQVNPKGIEEIKDLVEKGAGLVMLGGYSTFGNGDWAGTELDREGVLPVDLSFKGQEEDDKLIQMTPTQAGLREYGYVLGLANGDPGAEKAAWASLEPLHGAARIKVRAAAADTVLATSPEGDPLLIVRNYGKGRVLAFAGDSTWRWVRSTKESQARHSRFWRQMVIWLAHQELAGGNIWVRPELRDIPLGADLEFRVGARSKGGIDLSGGTYTVQVQTPGKQVRMLNTTEAKGLSKGTFKPDEAGEYRLKVTGKARDPDGSEVTGTAEARFLVHEEDVEMAEWSADKTLMDRLAREGRGQAMTAAELPDRLLKLLAPATQEGKTGMTYWPDWGQRATVGQAKGPQRSGFLVVFFLCFVACLSVEWFLRRRGEWREARESYPRPASRAGGEGDVPAEERTDSSWRFRHASALRQGGTGPGQDSDQGADGLPGGRLLGGDPLPANTSSAGSCSGKWMLPSAASSPLVAIQSLPRRMSFSGGGRSMRFLLSLQGNGDNQQR